LIAIIEERLGRLGEERRHDGGHCFHGKGSPVDSIRWTTATGATAAPMPSKIALFASPANRAYGRARRLVNRYGDGASEHGSNNTSQTGLC
jgi:hypothetical protein